MYIGYDPGFANTKTYLDGKVSVIQSAIAKQEEMGFATTGMKRYKTGAQITVEGETYVAGQDAWLIGTPIASMDYSSLSSTIRRVLFYATMTNLIPEGERETHLDLMVGLPVPLLRETREATPVLEAIKKEYKRTHEWKSGQKSYCLTIDKVSVLPQPVGAWAEWAITDALKMREGIDDLEVAILDLGMNTLDLYGIKDRKVVERSVDGAKVGVRTLLATLNGHGQDIEQIDYELRTNKVKPSEENVQIWLNEVLAQIERKWRDLRKYDAIIPVGGGVSILGDSLKNALEDKGAKLVWPKDPIIANAKGLWKLANYNGKE